MVEFNLNNKEKVMANVKKEEFNKVQELKDKEKKVKEVNTRIAYAKAMASESAFSEASAITDDTNIQDIFCQRDALQSLKKLNSKSKKGITFIHPDFDKFFKLEAGMLVAVLGYTGGGKTTSAANIAATVIQAGKKIVVFSNEESSDKYRLEVVSLLSNTSSYKLRNAPCQADLEAFTEASQTLQDCDFQVADSQTSGGATMNATSILKSLDLLNKQPKADRPDVVIIDYLQNITMSGLGAGFDTSQQYSLLENFCISLKNLVNTLNFSVIVMAQCHSDDKRKGDSADSKIIMGASLLRNSMKVVEVRADHKNSSTSFTISKNRDGNGHAKIGLTFKFGRYVTQDEDYQRLMASKNKANELPDEDED